MISDKSRDSLRPVDNKQIVRRFILAAVRTWREITRNEWHTNERKSFTRIHLHSPQKQHRSEKEKNQPKQTNKNNIFEDFGIWVMARRSRYARARASRWTTFSLAQLLMRSVFTCTRRHSLSLPSSPSSIFNLFSFLPHIFPFFAFRDFKFIHLVVATHGPVVALHHFTHFFRLRFTSHSSDLSVIPHHRCDRKY